MQSPFSYARTVISGGTRVGHPWSQHFGMGKACTPVRRPSSCCLHDIMAEEKLVVLDIQVVAYARKPLVQGDEDVGRGLEGLACQHWRNSRDGRKNEQ